jgi:diaminopimelate decarboxylase
MTAKPLPCSEEKLREIVAQYPTPFHIYTEQAIRDNARALKQAFAWNPGFRNYFAVKAAPNPFLLRILADEGFGADCSSAAELKLAETCGIAGEQIMFTSNDTPAAEYRLARELGAVINLDDLSHIDYLEEHAGIPDLISFRFNPGPLKEGNTIIGHPEDAKYGVTREQLFEGYRIMRDKGVTRFGIHTMVASNELDHRYFLETAQLLFELVAQISNELDIRFEFVNLGGGIGIPYRPEEKPVDLQAVGSGIGKLYEKIIDGAGLPSISLYMECGRMITGPYGWLVSRVLHKKETYKTFIGLDACMAHLMRPALYGAYHHITVPGKEDAPERITCDVTGSLCENNDKFAIDRNLPPMTPGDLVVIHDAGAHGHAMGFNYNGKLRSAELLLRPDGTIKLIRRAETLDDLFATLDFDDLRRFPV